MTDDAKIAVHHHTNTKTDAHSVNEEGSTELRSLVFCIPRCV